MREKLLTQDVRFPGYGTSLPASPADGDQFVLVDSLTAPTYSWLLRYVAAKASNKWVFVGGAAGFSEVTTQEATASTAYVALATAGPIFALPVAGDYMVNIGFKYNAGTAVVNNGQMSYDIGATGAVDADAAVGVTPATAGAELSISRSRKKTGLTAVTLTAKYKVPGGNSMNFGHRWMEVCPVAVGG